eukprot:1091500-Prymnesium_polylepis.2
MASFVTPVGRRSCWWLGWCVAVRVRPHGTKTGLAASGYIEVVNDVAADARRGGADGGGHGASLRHQAPIDERVGAVLGRGRDTEHVRC